MAKEVRWGEMSMAEIEATTHYVVSIVIEKVTKDTIGVNVQKSQRIVETPVRVTVTRPNLLQAVRYAQDALDLELDASERGMHKHG